MFKRGAVLVISTMKRAVAFVLHFLSLLNLGEAASAPWEAALLRGGKLAPKELEDVAAQAKSASAVLLAAKPQPRGEASCGSCAKAYAESCPQGWAALADSTCKAPESYGGYCAPVQSFFGFSVASRIEAEVVCGVCWPC